MSAVRFRIHLDAGIRIGSGLPSLTADDTVVRGADGRPVVPSTTLKGAVRSALAGLGGEGPDDATLRRVLGRAGASPGAVHFGDAVAPDGIEPVVSERTRVSLTSRRTAARGRLMTLEVLESLAQGPDGALVPLVLEGAVRCPEGDAEAAEVVALGLAIVRSIGADRSRGLGRVRVAVRIAPEVRR
jgi:hypothetical protein